MQSVAAPPLPTNEGVAVLGDGATPGESSSDAGALAALRVDDDDWMEWPGDDDVPWPDEEVFFSTSSHDSTSQSRLEGQRPKQLNKRHGTVVCLSEGHVWGDRRGPRGRRCLTCNGWELRDPRYAPSYVRDVDVDDLPWTM